MTSVGKGIFGNSVLAIIICYTNMLVHHKIDGHEALSFTTSLRS